MKISDFELYSISNAIGSILIMASVSKSFPSHSGSKNIILQSFLHQIHGSDVATRPAPDMFEIGGLHEKQNGVSVALSGKSGAEIKKMFDDESMASKINNDDEDSANEDVSDKTRELNEKKLDSPNELPKSE